MRLAGCRRAGSSALHPSTFLLLEIICDLKKTNNSIVKLGLWLGPELGEGDSSGACRISVGTFSSIPAGFLLDSLSVGKDTG